MRSIPDPIQAYKEQGTLFLKKGMLTNLFFSFGSYQAELQDPAYREPIYSFIQISKRGELKDFFCTCTDSEPGLGCGHITALYLLIIDDKGIPLHENYDKSIHKALARLFYEKGAVAKPPEKKSILIIDPGGSMIAKVALKTDRGEYLFEETFLSENTEGLQGLWGLSFEEGEKYKEQENSKEFLFEQSSWNEWGKKLSFLKALQKSKESLKTDKNGLPNSITLDFHDIKIEANVNLIDLPLLIPFLESIGGYPVLEAGKGERFESARYHEKSAILELTLNPIEKVNQGEAIYLPGWVFLKKKGFLREETFFPSSKVILREKIPDFLKKQGRAIAPLLKDRVIVEEPQSVKTTLSFDKEWNLEIKKYLFKKGDLQLEGSWLEDDYVYIQGKGFYRIEEKTFRKSHFIIPEGDVASFVHEKRSWLSQIQGFEIHAIALESEIGYMVQKDRSLLFTQKSHLQKGQKTKDFGAWIYVEDMGFFPRETSLQPFFIKPNTHVFKDHVPLFIKERREELKLIKGFFLNECPIDDIRLELKSSGPDTLDLKPVYQVAPDFLDKEIIFFEDVVYVQNEGFYELPPHVRLPEPYRYERTLKQLEIKQFFDEEINKLRRFIPILDASMKKPSSLKLFISKAEKSEKYAGLYKIKVFWGSEYDKIDFLSLWDGKNNKKRFLFTKAGLIDLSDDRFRWLSSIKKSRIDRRSGMITVSVLEFYRLDALEEMECSLIDPGKEKETEETINQLRQFKVSEKIDLTLLKSNLRPYQHTGVEWLWFLYVHGLSGLLCDDMGLGKTHQAMAMISSSIMANKTRGIESKERVLVVCPASVIHHWEDKIKEFMPELKASIYHGLERSYEGVSQSSDIVITTYGIVRRDIHLFIKTLFSIAIFDEVQIAKNKESRIHTVLKKIRAEMKIGLSGTPIENNLLELKSLFDIVIPHYMPTEGEFKERFIKPIQKEKSEEAKASLRRLIRPFVLRRKKNEVLLELPEKTEEISHCDLSKEQVTLYNGMLERSREPLMKQLSDETKNVPYFHVFALLAQLKKICNHPALFLKKSAEYEEHHSGKWNLFQELISEAFESGQKVVVFTQYLGMLDIMSAYFASKGVDYAMIKGSTKNRGEEIRRFNEDEKCRVFLGSLLAGGLGIDLIGGSIVIHYDRWWNAARENQATDRVYRIGQKRGVQVFKLVTKNTFEERIDEIIREKGKLAEDIVASEEAALKLFTRSELKTLLEYSRWDEIS